MKLRHLAVTCFLCLVMLAFPLVGRAASVYHYSGQNATAYFSSTDETGCISTDVILFAFDGKVKVAPGPKETQSEAALAISRYDYCTETYVMNAYGGSTLAGPDFTMRGGNLSSARIRATFQLWEEVSSSFIEVSADLTWKGIGAAQRGNDHYHFRSPGFMINNQSNSVYRSAEVFGTIKDETTIYNAGTSMFGDLSSSKSGSLTIGGETTPQ